MTYWLIRFRDPSKPKKAKPVHELWYDGEAPVLAILHELTLSTGHIKECNELDALTVEMRHMTPAEAKKWDRIVEKEHFDD